MDKQDMYVLGDQAIPAPLCSEFEKNLKYSNNRQMKLHPWCENRCSIFFPIRLHGADCILLMKNNMKKPRNPVECPPFDSPISDFFSDQTPLESVPPQCYIVAIGQLRTVSP